MSVNQSTIAFVTGASGSQGGATARQLLTAGLRVHALVRDPTSKAAVDLKALGARLFAGNFEDVSSLNAAVAGATAVFLNVSPALDNPYDEVQYARNIIEAAKASGTVSTIVYSSVTMTGKHESFPNWGPEYPLAWYWKNKAEIESLVRSSGIQHWTILRPAFLMKNYLYPTAAYMFPELGQRHTFLTAYKPTTAMTVLDPEDLGKFACAAIVEPQAYNKHEIDLGAEALTPAEIVQKLSIASGKNIALQFYSEEEAISLAAESPQFYSQLWANDVGYRVDFDELKKKYPIQLTTFSEYLAKHPDEVRQTFGQRLE